jgi:predicted esterase
VDRLALWAGGAPPDLDFNRFRSSLGAAPLLLLAGRRDRILDEAKLDAEAARLREHGVPFELRSYDAGHRVSAEGLRELDP